MYHVGLTGTRKGCNPIQYQELVSVMRDLWVYKAVFHHGDCIGVDQEGHVIAEALGYDIEIHPPYINTYRAFCKASVIHPVQSYDLRDRAIATQNHLIVVPEGAEENYPRSGTWKTYRMAVKAGTPFTIIRGGRW